jgi:hypothetical protein
VSRTAFGFTSGCQIAGSSTCFGVGRRDSFGDHPVSGAHWSDVEESLGVLLSVCRHEKTVLHAQEGDGWYERRVSPVEAHEEAQLPDADHVNVEASVDFVISFLGLVLRRKRDRLQKTESAIP